MPRRLFRPWWIGVAALAWVLLPAGPPSPRSTVPDPVSAVDALLRERSLEDPARIGRFAVCFAPGTPEAYARQVAAKAVAGPPLAHQAFEPGRWRFTATDGGPHAQGDPITLTWSIVPDGTFISGSMGEPSTGSDLVAYLDGIYGNSTVWGPLLQQVFDRWGELTGVRYVFHGPDDRRALGTAPGVNGVRADIRLGGHVVDGPFGVLAYNGFPDDGDMVIDTGGTLFQQSLGSNSRLLRNVVAHEHGHGLALNHVCPRSGTKLMEPNASTGFDGPQHDDILGAQRLYGDTHEPNDTSVAATDLGAFGPARFFVRNVSIDDDTDVDWYRFTAAGGLSVDVHLRPVGRQYDSGPEGVNGCGEKTRIDTSVLVDLRVELLAEDGTVLATADGAAAGGTESIRDVLLSADTGNYHVHVRGSGENDAQIYELELRLARRGVKPVASPDAASTWEVLPVEVDVLANDSGLDDAPIRLRVPVKPGHGKVKLQSGKAYYIPERGFTGEDTFTYQVSDAQSQSATATVDVTVQASPRAGNARVDTDLDGYPDEFETALGTSTGDIGDHPGENIAALGPRPLLLGRATLKLKPRKPMGDSIRLEGTLVLDPGFVPAGVPVDVTVGGVVRRFVLGVAGDAAAGPVDRISLRPQPDGSTPFELRLDAGEFATELADEGLDTARNARNEPRAVTVFVVVADRTFAADVPLSFTSRTGRVGKTKLVR